MNRTLQPLALLAGVGFLLILRLVAGNDMFASFIDSLLRQEAAITTGEENPRLQVLQEQIGRLEDELDFKQSSQLNLVAANIINKTSASFRQMVKIDRGTRDGVTVNQPVMSQGFLIGLVSDARATSSTVLLLGDPDLNIPVVTGRADGIASAKAGGLVVRELNDNNEAVSGQAVTTSGLGGLYPPGLLVGQLGSRLSAEILGEFVLERPFNLAELRIVQVVSP
jgi:rod shape-determining protein MreC